MKSANRPVRFTAQRLLTEAHTEAPDAALRTLALDQSASKEARVQALWTLQTKGALDNPTLVALFNDRVVPAEVVRAALKIFSEQPALANQHLPEIYASMGSVGRANDPFAPLTLAALLALGAAEPSAEANEQLVAAIPNLKDPFLQSAALAAATRSPGEFLRATLAGRAVRESAALQPFIAPVCAALAANPRAAEDLILFLAATSGSDVSLTSAMLTCLAEIRRPAGETNPREAQLQEALHQLLNRSELEAAAALPLAVAWNTKARSRRTSRRWCPSSSPS